MAVQLRNSQSSTGTTVGSLTRKRLITCCDGTWMDSDNGYEKPGLFGTGTGSLQIPSNVTRISRCFKKRCSDGTLQIVNYESGVGTGSGILDSVTGGAFGAGLSERVRDAYSYLCTNYADGDDIFLVGFSRGAFTARSVAGMISNLGLLTREGVDHFYPIFKDMQHWMDDKYDDPFPDIPFANKPKGSDAAEIYRARLEQMGYTRVKQSDGDLIKVKAVCVWDTVGSLGIPRVAWLDKLGIRPSNQEWHDTALSDRIEHAFQALALDETRPPFSPAVWERPAEFKVTTDLRQVWFPGNHGNIGGGWDDQGVANCTLAWMMDQMASIGVEFDKPSLDRIFQKSIKFYRTRRNTGSKPQPQKPGRRRTWAIEPIYENNAPLRPWGLGAIQDASSFIFRLSGKAARTPGLYRQTDPKKNMGIDKFLQDTNERVHSSVRIRLACKGLGLNDQSVWTCASLTDWQLRRSGTRYDDPIPQHPSWEPPEEEQSPVESPNHVEKGRWIWEYVGEQSKAPKDQKQRVMVEEPLGPYERYLLRLAGGTPNVYEFAEDMTT